MVPSRSIRFVFFLFFLSDEMKMMKIRCVGFTVLDSPLPRLEDSPKGLLQSDCSTEHVQVGETHSAGYFAILCPTFCNFVSRQ